MTFLSMLGLMKVEDHKTQAKPAQSRSCETLEQHIMDVNVAKSDAEWWAKERIETLQARLDVERKAPGIDWEAKYKAAVVDMAAQSDEIERLTAELIHADDSNRRFASEIEEFRTDAQLWRNARDKRSQGRGASSDAAPKAKKGVRS